MAALALLATAAILWIAARRRNGILASCALLAILPLIVPAFLPGMMGGLASERSLYLALPGWVGIAAFGASGMASRRPGMAPIFAGIGAGLVLFFAVMSAMRIPAFVTEEKLLESGLATHPRNPQLIFERGNRKLSSQDYSSAVKDYQAAISIRGGTFALASVNLAAAYIAQKDFGLALRLLDPIAAQAKHVRSMRLVDAKAHYHAGLVLMQQDRQKEAAEAFERMLLFYPDHLGAHGNLGLIYVKAPHYVDRGMEHLRFAIAREKDPAKRAGLEKGLQRAEGLIQVYIDKYGTTPAERDKPAEGVLGVPWETVAKEGM
jgi:tetratricopeptide (TPR) repeat protein